MNSASEIIKSTVGFSFREWIPLMPQGDATLGKATWVEYPEYKEKVVTKRGNPLGMTGPSGTQFPVGNRPVAAAFNDKFPGRQKVYLKMLVKHSMTFLKQEIRLCSHNKKFWLLGISLGELLRTQ